MTELSVLSVKKRGTKNVDLVSKTESLKTSFCPWKVLEFCLFEVVRTMIWNNIDMFKNSTYYM